MVGTCISSAVADSTNSTYVSAWRTFFRFCMAYEWSALDPSQELFMHFTSWMFLVGYPYGTIRTYVASIPSLYICIGVELSLAKTTYPALARCLKGIRRICPSVPAGKSEITLAILFAIRKIPTSVSLKSWPSGLHSVWVSPPSFDLETWSKT